MQALKASICLTQQTSQSADVYTSRIAQNAMHLNLIPIQIYILSETKTATQQHRITSSPASCHSTDTIERMWSEQSADNNIIIENMKIYEKGSALQFSTPLNPAHRCSARKHYDNMYSISIYISITPAIALYQIIYERHGLYICLHPDLIRLWAFLGKFNLILFIFVRIIYCLLLSIFISFASQMKKGISQRIMIKWVVYIMQKFIQLLEFVFTKPYLIIWINWNYNEVDSNICLQ